MKINKEYKCKYFEFTTGWSGFNIRYHVAGYFDSRPQLQLYFIWGKLFLYLPWKHYKKIEVEKTLSEKRKEKLNSIGIKKIKEKKKYIKQVYDQCETPSYGIYLHMDQLGINIGKHVILCDLPWSYEWIRTSALGKDGTWYHETKKNRNMEFYDMNKWKGILYSETFPYTYITRYYGEEQKCLATIRVQEMEWRWKWFTRIKYFSKVRRYIEVDFNTDIGERKGRWKGGVTGCSYNILKVETPLECLRRMENNKKF